MPTFIDAAISKFIEACDIILGTADSWANTNSGLIYNDPSLSHVVASPPPPDNISEAQKTWEAYKNKLDAAKVLYTTNLTTDPDGHNNNYFQDPTQVDPQTLLVEGRAGFLHRYAMAYVDLVSLYLDYKFVDKNGEQILIPDDYLNLTTDFPNLETLYATSIVTNTNTASELANSFYQNKYHVVASTGGMGGNEWLPDGPLTFPYLDNFLTEYPNWTTEKTLLKNLVTGLETRGNIAQNPTLRKAFALKELLSAVNAPIIQRDLSSWPTIGEFYESRGLNAIIKAYNIGLNTPGDFNE